ncbi:MAG: response regulator [Candidatus Omnitrophica bacterium]|nr:response regulator [Candidatus Omnitrophota bacterium]
MSDKRTLKVLVVDDEKVVRDFLARLLRLEGIEVKTANDGLEAIEAVKEEKFDLVFLDIRMPKMNGLEVFTELKKIDLDLRCIFMTGYALETYLFDKCKSPGIFCLRKPFEDINQIKSAINKVLQESKASVLTKEGLPERRVYQRLEVALEVDYRLKEKEAPFIHSLSKDISPDGIRIITQGELPPGCLLELLIRVPGYNEAFKATGKVIWNKVLQDRPGYYYAGIEFTEINLAEFTDFLLRSGRISV